MKKSVLAGLIAIIMFACGVRADAAEWETDFAKAAITAKASGKYMLLDFSGSDWCGWCMKLEAEVFSQPAFKTYASENLVCVSVDFPQDKYQSDDLKEQNQKLAEEFKIEGYPTIIILSPDGNLVEKTGYKRGGAANYVGYLKSIIDEDKRK